MYSVSLNSLQKQQYYNIKLACKHKNSNALSQWKKYTLATFPVSYNVADLEIEWNGGWKGVGRTISHGYGSVVDTYVGDTIFNQLYKYKFAIQITDHNRRHGSFIELVAGLIHPNEASKGVWNVPEGAFRLFNWHSNGKTAIVTTMIHH